MQNFTHVKTNLHNFITFLIRIIILTKNNTTHPQANSNGQEGQSSAHMILPLIRVRPREGLWVEIRHFLYKEYFNQDLGNRIDLQKKAFVTLCMQLKLEQTFKTARQLYKPFMRNKRVLYYLLNFRRKIRIFKRNIQREGPVKIESTTNDCKKFHSMWKTLLIFIPRLVAPCPVWLTVFC